MSISSMDFLWGDPLDANPFLLIWIERLAPNGYYCCPSNEIAQLVIKHFKTTSKDIRTRPSDILIRAFIAFWDIGKAPQHLLYPSPKSIVISDVKVDIIRTYTSSKGDRPKISELDGWLSLEHLNTCLSRDLHGYFNTPATNPFFGAYKKLGHLRARRTYTFPDLETLPDLYRSLGILSQEELKLGTGDLMALSEFCEEVKFDDILQTSGGIHAVETQDYWGVNMRMPTGTRLIFTNKPIANFAKQLATILANRKNPQGFKGGADVFSKITSGEIRGKQLGQLCMSNKELLRLCTNDDFAIFRRALRREFGIVWEAGLYGYKNARDLYGRMHTGYFFLNPEKNRAGFKFGGSQAPKDSVLVVPNATDPSDNIIETQDYLLFYNRASPSFSFVGRMTDGQLFGAGVLIESLGDAGQQFVDEAESEIKGTEQVAGEVFISQVVNATFGDEAMALFEIYQV